MMKHALGTLSFRQLVGGLLVGGAITCGASAQTPGATPNDTPTMIGGVEAVCTGVGMSDEDKLRWKTYPLKVVVSGKGGQFLAGEQLTVSQGGHEVVSVNCDGPWVLLKLTPGEYSVRATVDGKSVEARARVPKSGQGRVDLRFPNLGGSVSPEH
jgi:hypothetical protein